jgi:hypothetical protein
MAEYLPDTVKNCLAILGNPDATTDDKLGARINLATSRRLISKGVKVLDDI